MAHQSHAALAEIRDTLLETYAANDAMNQLILSTLDPRAWRAHPLGQKGSGRTIAAIFAHLHNCRLKWLKKNAPHLKCPAPLDPDRCTMKQAAGAHKKSAAQCLRMLADALSAAPNRRVTKFSRDSWMPTWPAGGTMFVYMFSHEAHHRGQILMLAHQLGYRVLHKTPGIWQWEKLWKTSRPYHPPALSETRRANGLKRRKAQGSQTTIQQSLTDINVVRHQLPKRTPKIVQIMAQVRGSGELMLPRISTPSAFAGV